MEKLEKMIHYQRIYKEGGEVGDEKKEFFERWSEIFE